MHSAGWELDRQLLTLSEHVGDLEGQVWRMCGLAGMMRGATDFPLRDALRVGATIFSCHLGVYWQVHVMVCRPKVTWRRRASPKRFRRAVHVLGMLCRLGFYALVRRVLGGMDGVRRRSTDFLVGQERWVDVPVGQS